MNFQCRETQVRGKSIDLEMYKSGEVEISHQEVRSGVVGSGAGPTPLWGKRGS